jgi:exonuclease SbcC
MRRGERRAAQELQAAAHREATVTQHEADGARAQLAAAVSGAGFADEDAARAAALPESEIERLARETARHEREMHALAQRVEELERELGGARASAADLASAATALATHEASHRRCVAEVAELDAQQRLLAQRVTQARGLGEQLAALGSRHDLMQQLANDLRSDRFQAYLLEQTFEELVAGASVRLFDLSGRYTLEYQGDAFRVLDHDNAREARSTDTLSGGETFLTSLALALELSAQVQRAAGAVQLDSLFIDEGFGTLDAETLDSVTSAIESLQIGGRTVGIITHIAELTERLPARICVEKPRAGLARARGARVSMPRKDSHRSGSARIAPESSTENG